MKNKENALLSLSSHQFEQFVKVQNPQKLSEIADMMGRKRVRSGAEAVAGTTMVAVAALGHRYFPGVSDILVFAAGTLTAMDGVRSVITYNAKRAITSREIERKKSKFKQEGLPVSFPVEHEVTSGPSPIVKT